MSFFLADEGILKSKLLTPVDKLVYFALVSFYNRKTKSCYPRFQTIADRLGCGKQTVQRSVARLKKLNIIVTKRRQSTLEYSLPLHDKLLSTPRVVKFDMSDRSNMIGINKTKLIKPYSYYNYKKRYSENSTPLPIQKKDFEYNGIQLKFYASEGFLDEFHGSDGNDYTKNRITNEIKKKTLNDSKAC